MTKIYVKNFSRNPGARYRNLGKASGEEFRDDVLVPAFTKDKDLVVNLDGVRGYGSSFLEEVFAGLVRLGKFSNEDIDQLVQRIETDNLDWKDEIKYYVNDELSRG